MVFGPWPYLHQLDLRGNPICSKHKYRDRLITGCQLLGKGTQSLMLI